MKKKTDGDLSNVPMVGKKIKNIFTPTRDVWFKDNDVKKIRMTDTNQTLHVVSTVCPDYSNNGQVYVFSGPLGSGISLTAEEHLHHVPVLLGDLKEQGFQTNWNILVADLPEVVDSQRAFYEKVAGSRDEYLLRCAGSRDAIRSAVGSLATVDTFSGFYRKHDLDYTSIQNQVAQNVRTQGEIEPFRTKFRSFVRERADLARKFRGRSLSGDELLDSGAHGMSLYITHGTLLRHIFFGKSLIVVNHETPNLQNFFLSNFVPGFEYTLNTPKFPLGILQKKFY